MKMSKVKAVFHKEIMDMLRDKKMIIMTFLMPILLYPLVFFGVMFIMEAVSSDMQSSEYSVAIVEEAGAVYDKELLYEIIENKDDELEYNLTIVDAKNPEEMLLAEELDTYVVVGNDGKKVTFEVYYLSTVTNSSSASNKLEDKLKLFNEEMSKKLLIEQGLDAEYVLDPVEISWEDKSTKEETVGSLLGSLLPFLLITGIITGTQFAAVDITAGEKERGTLETFLTLPIRNDELIMGKFLAVAVMGVVSAILNLLSVGIIGAYLMASINAIGEGTSINLVGFIPAMVIVLLCVIAFTLFLSAVMMCISIFAKSYKEASNLTSPVLIVVMLAAYIGFIPNIEFNSTLAAIPVVNICLLISNILVFKYEFSLILIVLISNVAYAALAILILSKIYNCEDVLFGESGASLQIFTSRKELKKGGVPNFSDAVIVMAVSMLLLLYVGSVLQVRFLLPGLLMTQIMLLAVPVFAAWYTKKDFKETFSLKAPKVTGVLGAVVLEIGVFLVGLVVGVVLNNLWPQDMESLGQSFDMMLEGVGFVPALLVIALAPAICEEGLFRGYLHSAAKKKFKPAVAIIIVAALFGIYHMSLVKFFTTGLLGLAFGYVVYKTGSIFLTALMHFINNAISVVFMFYGEQLESMIPVLFKETLNSGEMAIMLVIGAVCSVAGILLVNMGSKEK